ncbi:hypothetical protein RIVM261_019800 [Rivularia sp. IAM M-261]|nr:hypothetical protein RIVM261_019800 [Rivularia sp. IAM M-261]
MMLMNRLFKRLAVVLTVMGGIVIIWLAVNLVWSQLKISSLRFEGNVLAKGLVYALQSQETLKNLILLFITSAVEIALFWLLVILDVVSRYRGLIATLVLFIFVGIFLGIFVLLF